MVVDGNVAQKKMETGNNKVGIRDRVKHFTWVRDDGESGNYPSKDTY
jgi:hypothetical protein